MTRPTHIDTGHLVEIARKLFLKKGYAVSTAEIATEAGISEGSIFRRFPTKAALFRAAMGIPDFDLEKAIADLPEENSFRQNLVLLITKLLDFQRQVIPRIIMMWSLPRIVPIDALHPIDDKPPWKILKILTDFLTEETRAGHLSVKNADITARTIIGATHSFAFMEFMEHKAGRKPKEMDFAGELIDLLCEGIAP